MDVKTKLIAALDFENRETTLNAVAACEGCEWYKIGLQLFSRTGPTLPRYLLAHNKHVFLDLKLHDIPNTVAKAARAAAELGADLITVHAAGGRRMMEAARNAVEGTQTKLLAVTVLTSLTEAELRDEVGMPETPEQAVARLARLAVDAGAHGVVASPLEVELLRKTIGAEPLIVTPGVCPDWAEINDQARVTTPRQAALAGADFIVVGRPIFKHANPAEAVQLILKELVS